MNTDEVSVTIQRYISQIKVKNPENTKYVENMVARRDMTMFVCEDGQDSDSFVEHLRKNMKLAVNCCTVPSEPVSQFQPEPLDDQMRYLSCCFAMKSRGFSIDLFAP